MMRLGGSNPGGVIFSLFNSYSKYFYIFSMNFPIIFRMFLSLFHGGEGFDLLFLPRLLTVVVKSKNKLGDLVLSFFTGG